MQGEHGQMAVLAVFSKRTLPTGKQDSCIYKCPGQLFGLPEGRRWLLIIKLVDRTDPNRENYLMHSRVLGLFFSYVVLM